MTRRTSLLVAAAAAAVIALAPVSGANATGPVLTGPDSTWTTTGIIAEAHTQASCAVDPSAPLPVVEAVCPSFPIVLDAADSDALHYLDVRLDMTAVAANRTVEDYDIYLYDAAGTEIDSSANAVGASEVIARNLIPDGQYTIVVVPFTNLPDSTFTLTARYRTAAG